MTTILLLFALVGWVACWYFLVRQLARYVVLLEKLAKDLAVMTFTVHTPQPSAYAVERLNEGIWSVWVVFESREQAEIEADNLNLTGDGIYRPASLARVQ